MNVHDLHAAFVRCLDRLTACDEPERLTQTEAAKRLGVSRWHLNRVLKGHRVSRSLTRRFRELQEEAAQ